MKPKTMILMIVAVACGLVAAILVKNLAARPPGDENVELVLVAVTDLKPGDKIDNVEQKFEQKKYLKNTAPFGSFTPDDVKAKPEKIIGKTLVKALAKGEAITEKHLTDENITNDLQEGYRAMSVPVRIDNIISGFALPGTRVDLITKYGIEGSAKTVSKIFLQNIKILAVGTETKKPEGATTMASATVVTLAVLPKDAAKINWTLASGGQITMALRRPDDDKTVKPSDTQVAGLGGSSDAGLDDETTETVLVALRDIEKGTDLKGKDLKEYFKEQRVPQGLFGADVFVKNMGDESLKDAKAKETIKQNTPVMRVLLGEAAAATEKPVDVQAPEEHQLTIYNGSREPSMTKFQRAGGSWSSRAPSSEGSSAAPMPAPSKDPADKEAPKTGSEGK